MLINEDLARERQAQIRRELQAINGRFLGVPIERNETGPGRLLGRLGRGVAGAVQVVVAIIGRQG